MPGSQQNKMPKGLPKRTRNQKAKETRAASWKRTQDRKAARRAENKARADRNKASSGITPWQRAKAKRAEARAERLAS